MASTFPSSLIPVSKNDEQRVHWPATTRRCSPHIVSGPQRPLEFHDAPAALMGEAVHVVTRQRKARNWHGRMVRTTVGAWRGGACSFRGTQARSDLQAAQRQAGTRKYGRKHKRFLRTEHTSRLTRTVLLLGFNLTSFSQRSAAGLSATERSRTTERKVPVDVWNASSILRCGIARV